MTGPKRKSLAELKKSEHVGLPERLIEICVSGRLVAEIEELDVQFRNLVNNAPTNPNKRVASGKDEQRQIADRMDVVRAQMAEHMVTIRVRAIKPAEWRALAAEHPPADGNRQHDLYQVNLDALEEMAGDFVVEINGNEPGEGDWEFVRENAGGGDLRDLAKTIAAMHVSTVSIPKSRNAWLDDQRKDKDSE